MATSRAGARDWCGSGDFSCDDDAGGRVATTTAVAAPLTTTPGGAHALLVDLGGNWGAPLRPKRRGGASASVPF